MSEDKRMLDVEENIDFCPQCEADLAPYRSVGAMPSFCLQCKFPLMLVADKYRLQKAIGQGAVGTVYLARHIRLNHNAERVVKVIKQELLTNKNTVQRFLREVQVTADLSERNEHIIRIYDDFGEIPHLGYFYVMEYIRGVSMRHFIQRQKHLPDLQWCLSIMGQLCEALDIAHGAGVVHRDLKPDNLMLTEKPNVGTYLKVLDWGIAKPTTIVDENLTQGLVGTPHYMAPEQAMNLEIDARTDLYATAVILYELLTGINPFVAATGKKGKSHESMVDLIQAHLYEEPPPIKSLTPQRNDITPAIEGVIMKALEKKPADRYDKATDFFRALCEAANQSGVHVEPAKTGLYQLALTPSQEGAKIPSGPGSGGLVPTGQPLADVSSNASAYPGHLSDDSQALKTTLDGDLSLSHDSSQSQKSGPRWPLLLGLLFFLAVLGAGGTWLVLNINKPTKQPRDRALASARTAPTSQRTTPNGQQGSSKKAAPRGLTPRWVATPSSDAGAAPDKPKAAPPAGPRRATPPRPRAIRPRPRRRWKRRFQPRRRWRKRRRQPPPRPASPCPSADMIAIKISPFLNRRAEVTAEPGRSKRISASLLCVTASTKRVSIIQEGYAPCIFRLPSGRKAVRIRLQSADDGQLSADACLR